MLESAIEMVKFFGGLGGLASSAFLVYDRLVRNQPLAFLVPKEYKTSIRFRNVTLETVIIDDVVITPPMLRLDRANDLITENAERAAVWYGSKDKEAERIFIVLKPGDERTFALHRFADFENSRGDQAISLKCRWKNTRGRFRIPRYVKLRTTVKEVRDIREASLANKI